MGKKSSFRNRAIPFNNEGFRATPRENALASALAPLALQLRAQEAKEASSKRVKEILSHDQRVVKIDKLGIITD